MPQYIVKDPLRHDGEDIAIGETVELTVKAAKPLLDAGVIEPAPAAKAPAKKDEKQPVPNP